MIFIDKSCTSNAHSFTGTTSWVLMLRLYYNYVNGFIVKYPRKTENQILYTNYTQKSTTHINVTKYPISTSINIIS